VAFASLKVAAASGAQAKPTSINRSGGRRSWPSMRSFAIDRGHAIIKKHAIRVPRGRGLRHQQQ
jgi:hypothetical protein